MKKLRSFFVVVLFAATIVASFGTAIQHVSKLSYADWGDPMGISKPIALINETNYNTILENKIG